MTIKLFREGSQFVAQLLDHDLAAQGSTEAEALEALAHVMRAHDAIRERDEPTAADWRTLPPAPDEYKSIV